MTRSKKLNLLKIWLLTPAMGLIGAAHADDIFLKVPGVVGPSTNARHPGEIPLLAFSPLASSPAGVVKPCGQFTAIKPFDQSSPVFLGDLYKGTHIASATVSFAKAGPTQQGDYYKLTLTNVLIVGVNAAEPQNTNLENMTLSAQSVTATFDPRVLNAGQGLPVTFGWDCTKNAPI